MIWARNVALMGEMRNVYKILIEKLQDKRPLRKIRYRWEGNVKNDLDKYNERCAN
jgi:hypothetical protein